MSFIRRLSSISPKRATIITGDQNGPFLLNGVIGLLRNIGVPLDYDIFTQKSNELNQDNLAEIIQSVKKNGLALKGPWKTSLSNSAGSSNITFRRELDLWAEVVHVKSQPTISTRNDIDFYVIRQNTEGEYSQIEHENLPGVVEMYKITTAERAKQIANFAFDFAQKNNRKKVTCIHKANIMKMGDGLFLSSCKDIAAQNPSLIFQDMIVDNAAMQVVMKPSQFDIMLLPNLYGSIMIAIGAGIVGNSNILSGSNFSNDGKVGVFEAASRNSEDVSQPPHLSNPIALINAACDMLKHSNLNSYSDIIHASVNRIVQSNKIRTHDMGGHSTAMDFINAVETEIKTKK